MKQSVSMLEVAKAAGVAKSTVSLALRNDPRVAPASRERIVAIANKMGYQPKPLVARLMYELRATREARYISTLALVNCSHERDIHTNSPSFALSISGMKQRATLLGYTIDQFWLRDPEVPIERLTRIFTARNIQGVIFSALEGENDLIELDPKGAIWNHFPSISVGIRLRQPPLSFAINDHYATGYQLGFKLQGLGYTKIGIVMDRWLHEELERRFVFGFLASREGQGHPVPSLYLKGSMGNWANEQNQRAFAKWRERHQPEACVCLNYNIYDWIVEAGQRVPEDIGVAFLDLSPYTQGMAGMNQRTAEIGMAAVDTLVGQILRRENSLQILQYGVMIESVWQSGHTVRARKDSPSK